jgi:hypothetical protein
VNSWLKSRGSISKGKLLRLQNFTHAKAQSRKGFGRSMVKIREFVAKRAVSFWRWPLALNSDLIREFVANMAVGL